MRGAVVFLALLPTSLVFPSLKIGRTQSAAVKGVLICNGKPAANVNVKLYNGCRGQRSIENFFKMLFSEFLGTIHVVLCV